MEQGAKYSMIEQTPDTNDKKITDAVLEEEMPDENMHLFVYGNLTIRDIDSGAILVNKSF